MPSALVSLAVAMPRIAMGFLFLAAATKFYPDYNNTWMTGDIDKSAWLFNGGSWFYFIATMMDGVQHFKTGNVIKIGIFFIYLVAGLCVTVGSCFFLQEVQKNWETTGDFAARWFISAGIIMLVGVHADLAVMLSEGRSIIWMQSLAVLAIVPGAFIFTVATAVSFSKYLLRKQPVPALFLGIPPEAIPGFDPANPLAVQLTVDFPKKVAFEMAASLFMVASFFFIVHALFYLFAVHQILNTDPTDAAMVKNDQEFNSPMEVEEQAEAEPQDVPYDAPVDAAPEAAQGDAPEEVVKTETDS